MTRCGVASVTPAGGGRTRGGVRRRRRGGGGDSGSDRRRLSRRAADAACAVGSGRLALRVEQRSAACARAATPAQPAPTCRSPRAGRQPWSSQLGGEPRQAADRRPGRGSRRWPRRERCAPPFPAAQRARRTAHADQARPAVRADHRPELAAVDGQVRVARAAAGLDVGGVRRGVAVASRPAARAAPQPTTSSTSRRNAPFIVRTRSTGATSPSRMLRIGLTLNSVPASAAARPMRPPRCKKSASRAAPGCAADRALPRAARRSPPARRPWLARSSGQLGQPARCTIETDARVDDEDALRIDRFGGAAGDVVGAAQAEARLTQMTASCCWSCSRNAVSNAAMLGAPVLGSDLLVRRRR